MNLNNTLNLCSSLYFLLWFYLIPYESLYKSGTLFLDGYAGKAFLVFLLSYIYGRVVLGITRSYIMPHMILILTGDNFKG